MDNSNQERKNLFKTWLETLQQESWQLELLISGLALFGVFGAKSLIDDLEGYFDIQFFRGAAAFAIEIFIFLLKGSWYIFLINLTIHIVLRGLWIGAIGLRYVSNEIDYNELNYSTYFRKLFTRRYASFDDYIEELEKICSVIFAYTFLLFFILISACLTIIWPVIIASIFGQWVGAFLIFLYIIFGAIVLIDFILLNPMKKIKDKWVSRVYGWIFRFYSTITLSFIFRPLLLNFLDNKFTKKLFIFSIPYGIVIILILPRITSESIAYFPKFNVSNLEHRAYYSQAINPNLYDNLMTMGKAKISYMTLGEDRIDGDILEFFLVHFKSDENYFSRVKDLPKINKVGVYSGFKRGTIEDTTFVKLREEFEIETNEFLQVKRDSNNLYSEQEWDEIFQKLTSRQDSIRTAYYSRRAKKINGSFEELNRFFIDDINVSSEVECLMSRHSNLGEKGWRCFLNLDTLENGIHHLTIYRGFYDARNLVINPRKLEIPFILDR